MVPCKDKTMLKSSPFLLFFRSFFSGQLPLKSSPSRSFFSEDSKGTLSKPVNKRIIKYELYLCIIKHNNFGLLLIFEKFSRFSTANEFLLLNLNMWLEINLLEDKRKIRIYFVVKFCYNVSSRDTKK